ncbi:MAG TPA: class I lanthipeptide [Polyangia bacterium]|jgi:hypothetical protein|nr:class I lanthipeptide [Polyangia bacterium]
MKTNTKNLRAFKSKLSLSKQTVRRLQPCHLENVAGGGPTAACTGTCTATCTC